MSITIKTLYYVYNISKYKNKYKNKVKLDNIGCRESDGERKNKRVDLYSCTFYEIYSSTFDRAVPEFYIPFCYCPTHLHPVYNA
jgi:hypothetical protein